MNSLLGSYRYRNTPLHRLPALAKVILLFAWVAASLAVNEAVSAIGMAASAVLLLASVLPPFKATARAMFGIVLVAAFTAAYNVWHGEVRQAIDTSADLIGLFALSLAITGSTPMGETLDLIAKAARPFKRLIPPAIPGLMFSLMIRAIPEVAQIMAESRMALKARGIERSITGLMIPTATRTVGFALDLGAALHARGIADDAVAGHADLAGPLPDSQYAGSFSPRRRARANRG